MVGRSSFRTWGPRFFSARTEEPRARRYSDVASLLLAVVGLALVSLVASPPARFEDDLMRIIAAVPTGLSGLWRTLIDLLFVFALVSVGAALVRRRWALLRDMLVAFALVVAGGLLVGRLVQGSWELVWNQPIDAASVRGMPWLPLTSTIAITAVTLPHLTRAVRRLARWMVTLAVTGAILLGAVVPSQGITTLLLGLATSAAVHLGFGSVRGRPELDDVAEGLGLLGVEVVGLRVADRRQAGVFVLNGRVGDDGVVDIKVYGGDAYDTQFLGTLWRTVWFREPGTPLSPGRVQQVEHEAFLTLLAGQAGIPVQPVVTAGLTPRDDAVLVLEQIGSPAPTIEEGWTTADGERLWDLVIRMDDTRIAHNQIDDRHLFVDGSRMGLIDFSGATLASHIWWRRIDQVQALALTVVGLGLEPAIELARRRLGEESLVNLLPYLQSDILTPRLRHLVDARADDVDAIRDAAAGLLAIEAPELVRLRRVTLASLVRAVLPFVAFFALASVFAGLDLADLADALEGASWWFVAVGVLVAQLPRLSQAVSALGASPVPVPLGRLYLLQLAQQYIGLTIPGAAARVAMNVRFFQRHGLASGSALTVGALDSLFGFLVQILLVLGILALTSATLDLDLSGATSIGLERLLVAISVLVAASVALMLTLPALRTRIVGWVRRLWKEARVALQGLASSRRLGLLLGGNLLSEVLFALTLGAFTLALGFPIGFGELIFIHVTVSLLSGLVPVPGGIGVFEGALTFGLVRAGMPEEVAFAAALMFRMATFYVPPAWGMVAFRWLERNKHL
jgi:glycosyltransferase 2 family protein